MGSKQSSEKYSNVISVTTEQQIESTDLVESYQSMLNKKLIIACLKGDYDQVTQLVNTDEGVDVNTVNDVTGLSPLICASVMKHVDIVQVLLKLLTHTDVNYKDMPILNCLCRTVGYDCFEILDLLLENGVDIESKYCGSTALVNACELNNFELVRYLVNKGADVNANVNSKSWQHTPLSASCVSTNGDPSMAKFLIERGAVHTSIGDKNTTVLMCVCSSTDFDKIVELLLSCGADYTAIDADNRTAMWHAIYNERHHIIKKMLEYKVPVPENIQNETYIDVEMWASVYLQSSLS